MKKFLSLLAVVGLVAVAGCAESPTDAGDCVHYPDPNTCYAG